MTKLILTLISGGFTLAAAIISRNRKSKPTKQQLAEKDIHDARTASATGDAPTANAIIERNRITKSLLIPLAALLIHTGCGCNLLNVRAPLAETADDLPPKTIVITADRYMYPMTNEQGVAGWFVPDAVHAEFLEATILLQYYRKELKK